MRRWKGKCSAGDSFETWLLNSAHNGCRSVSVGRQTFTGRSTESSSSFSSEPSFLVGLAPTDVLVSWNRCRE